MVLPYLKGFEINKENHFYLFWSESDACSDPEPEPDKGNGKGKQIIDVDPNATIATAKIQKNEPKNPEEGGRLFHSQMWVKGSPLHFIVNSGSQKNLISAEVVT